MKRIMLPLARQGSLEHRGSITRRMKESWTIGALVLMTFLNFALLFKLTSHPQSITLLDDFQMLKPQFEAWAPAANTSDPNSRAVVSALYNDLFTIPVATLGHSLLKANTSARRILFHIPGRLSDRALCIVRTAGWELLPVDLIPPPRNGAGIGHRFGDQYTKLHLWSLDSLLGVNRVVYLDADTHVRRNIDELFDMPFPFGVVPDVYVKWGFQLHFNAGVLVLHPNYTTFERMRARIYDARFPPGEAEQAFFNVYFGADAVRLPYLYNANLAIVERSPELWQAMRDEIRIVHYTYPKPFPTDGKGIVDGLRLERAVEEAKSYRGGAYAEAIGWWIDAYHEFRTKHQLALEQCDV
ncbi:nucleotide-diphospho-sugar transferase [Russula dissimulans]|nr:nucleotide-diphospho-sugar transferase [Russula dissimulans]